MNDQVSEILVSTDGEAFLRNGFSTVKALCAQFWGSGPSDRVTLCVLNSRGRITNGYIWVPREALIEFARRVLAGCARPTVAIEVEGGVATVVSRPDWVDVEIYDIDTESPADGEGEEEVLPWPVK